MRFLSFVVPRRRINHRSAAEIPRGARAALNNIVMTG
jgi:hypothetical protein